MGSLFKPKVPKGPSQQDIQQRADAAAAKERDRLAQERAAQDAQKQQTAEADLAKKESQRQAFAGLLATTEDQDQRKRFLKGA
jgi:hypothetical protein